MRCGGKRDKSISSLVTSAIAKSYLSENKFVGKSGLYFQDAEISISRRLKCLQLEIVG